jgi:putative nucleotidyltransferase with HDIG domain
MKNNIIEMFPEIEDIQSTELQQKVIACWQEAMAFRHWTSEELTQIAFTLLAEGVKIGFLEHVRTCARMAIAIDRVMEDAYGSRRTPVNRDYLIAGALLADVGKLLEYDKKPDGTIYKSDFGKYIRHPFSGVGLAYKHQLPAEVLHVIAVHSKEGAGENRSPEAIIFHHVDFIDFDLVKFKP